MFSFSIPSFAQKALVSNQDRQRVLQMLSSELPSAKNELGDLSNGEELENLPDGLNTEAIKDALTKRKDVPLYAHNPIKGPLNAPVTIVEFSDVACQTCSDVFPDIEKLVLKYPKHIRWVHKQAPMNPFGQNSLAGFYSKIAHEYGLFWPYRLAVRKITKHSDESLVQALVDAGVAVRNSQQLVRLHARDVYRGLDADSALNLRIGLKSPPAVLVNGIVIGGAIPLEKLDEIVKFELVRQGIDPQEAMASNNKDKKAQENGAL